MEKFVTISFILILAISASSQTKQYRSDYVYNQKTDAFYKLHIESAAQSLARMQCAGEGAKLMVPTQQDIVQLHGMMKRFPDLGKYVYVDSDNEEHDPAEDSVTIMTQEYSPSYEGMLCDVVTRSGEVETMPCYRELPFICKVAAKDIVYNRECNVYGNDYVSKVSTTGCCYKISKYRANWNEANAACNAEGAHLIVLRNQAEFETVKELIKATPNDIEHWQFFAGIRAEKKNDGTPEVFKTIANQTLEEVGYAPWDDNEPNNEFGIEFCVSLLKTTAKYNDTVCKNRYSFICQKEIRV